MAASAFLRGCVRAIVYVDGFNLYYRALKGLGCNWLNLQTLAGLLLPKYTIVKIRYFTALVAPSAHDRDQHLRQQTYIRALETLPNIEVHYGTFMTGEKNMPDAAEWRQGRLVQVRVIKTEEKGSDVNIATHMLCDGFRDAYDVAALVSNDTDLVEPLRVIREELSKGVALLTPGKHPSPKLARYASTIRQIRPGVLRASLFPDVLSDVSGTFSKPSGW